MATIGHSLLGLSLSGLARVDTRRPWWRFVWPGFMIASAHLIDLIEWGIVLIGGPDTNNHVVTHSPWLAIGVAGAFVLIVGAIMRLRFWAPLGLAAIAVLSHVVLDAQAVRRGLVLFYGAALDEGVPRFVDSFAAECWLYGLATIAVLLATGARRPQTPRRGRNMAWLLVVLATAAAATRNTYVWPWFYAVALGHGLLLHRTALRPAYALGLVPLIPLFLLVGVEAVSANCRRQARQAMTTRDYKAAIRAFSASLAWPTRSSPYDRLIQLGVCFMQEERWMDAEAVFRRAIKHDVFRSGKASVMLASLYARPELRETVYYQPREAVALCRQVIGAEGPAPFRKSAMDILARLQDSGAIDE